MARFYDKNLNKIDYVEKKDGKGTRKVWTSDAIKNLWAASISSIASTQSGGEWLIDWKVGQYLDAAFKISNKDGLELDAWKDTVKTNAEIELSKAPDIGSGVHAAIEQYFTWRAGKGPTPVIDSKFRPYVRALDEFAQKYSIRANPEDLEKAVVLKEAPAAGTMDFKGEGFGLKTLFLDWKTQKVRSNRPNFRYNYWLQLAAYWAANGQQGDAALVILDTSRHEEYTKTDLPNIHWKVLNTAELRQYYTDFLYAAHLYYRNNEFDIDALKKAFA